MRLAEETLAAISKQILESMAFAFEMPGQPEPSGEGEMVRASVAFHGVVHGSFSLMMPQSAVPALVGDMLGEDEGAAPTRQQQYDALGELANVICGNLVQAMAGPEPVFRLDSPRTESNPALPCSAGPDDAVTRTRISLDSGCVDLVFVVMNAARQRAGAPA